MKLAIFKSTDSHTSFSSPPPLLFRAVLHPNFTREDPSGCFQISRKPKKSSKSISSTEIQSIASLTYSSTSSVSTQDTSVADDDDDDSILELFKNCQTVTSSTSSFTGSPFLEKIQETSVRMESDDLEPIPFNPNEFEMMSPITFDDGPNLRHSNSSEAEVLEPRKIEDMVSLPDTSLWYDLCPTMSPKQQALMEYSLPLVLSGISYSSRFSNFGHIWCILIIVGHTIETMFTSFGPSAKDLSYRPIIGPLHHHFIDCMWLHTLISALILVSDAFSPVACITGILMIQTLPIYLAVSLKTHFTSKFGSKGKDCNRKSMDQVIKMLFVWYSCATVCALGGYILTIFDLKVLGVFLFNASPLVCGESYVHHVVDKNNDLNAKPNISERRSSNTFSLEVNTQCIQ